MKPYKKTNHCLSLFVYFLLLFAIIISPAVAEGEQTLTKVTENIYTITKGAVVDSNTTFIVSDDGVLVIDTQANPDEALKVLREIRKITSKPITYVINTHFHGDHVFGNQMFAQASSIIAHKNV